MDSEISFFVPLIIPPDNLLTIVHSISDNTPTAILRPPPIPIGGQMIIPSVPSVQPAIVTPQPTASTLVPPGSVSEAPRITPTSKGAGPKTPISGPPASNIGSLPPSMFPPSASKLGPLAPTKPVSKDIGPPPPMMTPTSLGLGPPPASNMGPPVGLGGALGPPLPSASVPQTEIGPPPPMMAPQTFQGPPTAKSGPLGRPRRAAYPVQNVSNVPMGMDPTAPSSDIAPKNIGPPPMGGFRH